MLVALIVAVAALSAAVPPDVVGARLERYLDACAALGHFSGAALVARDGRELLSKAYGPRDAAGRAPNTTSTVFRVASITKQFTAMGLMILQERGRLDVDDRVGEYLPDAPAAWSEVTLRNLLNHTSGIPDYESELGLGSAAYLEFLRASDAPARIVAAARSKPLRFAPGTRFEYSNTGYVVLGFVLQRVSGKPLDVFLRDEIFAPLGMKDTFHDSAHAPQERRAAGLVFDGEFTFPRFFAGFEFPRDFAAAPALPIEVPAGDAGICTTAQDLLRWDRALAGDELVSSETQQEMFTPAHDGYGFGWFVEEEGGRRHAYHDGMLPGFTSRIDRYIEDGLLIVLLGNTDQSVDRIAADLAAICRGEAVRDPVKRTIVALTDEQLEPLLGTYRDGSGRSLEVRRSATSIIVEWRGHFTTELLAEGPRAFWSVFFDGPVRFEANEKDEVSAIVLCVKDGEWRAQRERE